MGHDHRRELEELVGAFVPWYCVPNMRLTLQNVPIETMTDQQVEALARFDSHTLFGLDPRISINFLNGHKAVAILKGIRTEKWTKEEVLTALNEYEAKRLAA